MRSYHISVSRCDNGNYYAQCGWGGVESKTLEDTLSSLGKKLTNERRRALRAFTLGEFELYPGPTRRIQSALIASIGLPNADESDNPQETP